MSGKIPVYTFGKTSSPLLLIVGSAPAKWFAIKSKKLKYCLNSSGKLLPVADEVLRTKYTGIRAIAANKNARIE